MKNVIFSAILALCLLTTGQAYAVCSSPAGVAGEIEYDTTANTFEYCDDTNWVDMKHDAGGITGLIGHWKLDETSGSSITDSSGSGNTGTWSDSVDDDVTGETAAGVIDTSINFDGSNDKITLTSASAANKTAFTMSGWFKSDVAVQTTRQVVYNEANTGQCDNETVRLQFLDGQTGQPGTNVFLEANNTTVLNAAQVELKDSTWHHMVGVVDTVSDDHRLYVDGVEYTQTTAIGTLSSQTVYTNIGGRGCANGNMDGEIDDVRIYDRALTKAEALALYAAGIELDKGLLGHWELDETTGTVLSDSSAGGNDSGFDDDSDDDQNDDISAESTTGRVGTGAIDFDGTDDYGAAPATNLLTGGYGELTAAAWVKVGASNNSNARIITYANNDNDRFTIRLDDANTTADVSGYVESGNTEYNLDNSSDNVITDADWHHVTMTFTNGDTTRLYVDAVEVGEQIGSNGSGTVFKKANDIVYIGVGNHDDATHFFDGVIDDVRIYDRALNFAEIENLNHMGALIGHWKLDESGNTSTAVDSISANNGTLTSFPADPTANWVTGNIDGALDFDGTNDHILVSSPDLPTDDFTYAMWAYLHTVNDEDLIMISDGAGGNEIDLFVDPALTLDINDGTVISSTGVVTANTWTHIAITRSGSSVQLYINAVPDGSGTEAATLNFSTCDLIIGADADSACTGTLGNYTNGLIDDLRIYDRGLNAAEVSDLYNTTTPCSTAGQMYYDATDEVFKFCDGTDTWPVAPDGVGGGGCVTPTATAGAMNYNAGTDVMQYCDGASWVDID